MGAFIDRVGQRFGRLVVLRRSAINTCGKVHWACACDCGKTVTVMTESLKKGRTQSCGCYNRDAIAARNRTHGLSGAPEYGVLRNAIRRCHDPRHKQFKDYGGRGIQVCEDWRNSFAAFYQSVGPRPTPFHTLDRIDFNGNYAPGNVRWATRLVQNNNTRANRRVTAFGLTQTVSDWSREVGIPRSRICRRLNLGWTAERALTKSSRGIGLIEFMGRRKSLNEWAAEYGIDRSTVRRRMKVYQWSFEKALTTPANHRRLT